MDSITHIVVGACAGELIAGKQAGKKAMLLGALANSLPDIDIIASAWCSVSKDLLVHRGFTHSILFALLVSPLLALVSSKRFRTDNISMRKWLIFWLSLILLHLCMDCCNAYGTGLFEPFSHMRVSWNLLFVADPLFTLLPLVAAIVLLILKKEAAYRRVWSAGALVMSLIYVATSILFRSKVEMLITKSLDNGGFRYTKQMITPTPLNNLLWYAIAVNDSGYYIGYYSVLDKASAIHFHFVYKNDAMLSRYRDDEDVRNLLRFSQGYYTVSQMKGKLVFNDIRFGETGGWAEENNGFVFYYYVNDKGDNDAVIQRGRFAGWDGNTLRSFINRIKGI